jgi:hypothetical protein
MWRPKADKELLSKHPEAHLVSAHRTSAWKAPASSGACSRSCRGLHCQDQVVELWDRTRRNGTGGGTDRIESTTKQAQRCEVCTHVWSTHTCMVSKMRKWMESACKAGLGDTHSKIHPSTFSQMYLQLKVFSPKGVFIQRNLHSKRIHPKAPLIKGTFIQRYIHSKVPSLKGTFTLPPDHCQGWRGHADPVVFGHSVKFGQGTTRSRLSEHPSPRGLVRPERHGSVCQQAIPRIRKRNHPTRVGCHCPIIMVTRFSPHGWCYHSSRPTLCTQISIGSPTHTNSGVCNRCGFNKPHKGPTCNRLL